MSSIISQDQREHSRSLSHLSLSQDTTTHEIVCSGSGTDPLFLHTLVFPSLWIQILEFKVVDEDVAFLHSSHNVPMLLLSSAGLIHVWLLEPQWIPSLSGHARFPVLVQ